MKYFIILLIFSASLFAADLNVHVHPDRKSEINPRIFGHFLERPSWETEFGIEDAVVEGTHKLDPRVVKMLRDMEIPVLRFPGGTDVDYMDWTDMIDLPGREARPVSIGIKGDSVTNRFGYDEFFELTQELDCEAIIPVNFFDAYLKRQPPRQAALTNVGLVAYCNAEVGQKLPDGMRDWPAIRAQNGHEEPFKFKYFQIGNETFGLWQWKKALLEEQGFDDPIGWYIECAAEYINMIEDIDPDIKIIADFINPEHHARFDAALGDKIDYYVYHRYMPWAMNDDNVEKNGEPFPIEQMTMADAWRGFVSTPGRFDENGMAVARHQLIDLAREQDFKIAVTEWNWNGWWGVPREERPLESLYAKSVGVAGFLHGFMRASDVIDMACQSMLVGSIWNITGIRVDKQGEEEPYYFPAGQMTSFYGEHHGDYLLQTEFENVPTYEQPFRLASLPPSEKVAVVDVVATGSEDRLAIFIINRHFSDAQTVEIDLSKFDLATTGEHIILTGALHDENVNPPEETYLQKTVQPINVSSSGCSVQLPARSVSVVMLKTQ